MIESKNNIETIVELLIKLGDLYLDDGNVDQGIQKYEEALALSNDDEQILSKLGDAYATRGDYNANAITIFRKILEKQPDNKRICLLLSEVYLRNKQFDEEAKEIYVNALNYYPHNHIELSCALIHYLFKNHAFDVFESITDQDLFPGFQSDLLIPYYLSIGWLYEAYKQVSNIYKFIIYKKYNSIAHKYFVINYLKYFTEKHEAIQEFYVELEDLQLCHSYLKSVKQFDHLEDIYLYLAVKQILRSNFVDDVICEDQSVSEYELFLNDNSSSNIWDIALNKTLKIDTSFDFSEEIWFRVKNNKANDETHRELDLNHQDDLELEDVSSLMFIQIMNFEEVKQNPDRYNVMKAFDAHIQDNFDAAVVKYIKRVNDGYLVLGRHPFKLIDTTISFSKKYSYGENTPIQFFIGLHTKDQQCDILDELNVLFELQQLHRSLLHTTAQSFDSNKIITSEDILKNLNGQFIPKKDFASISPLFRDNDLKIFEIIWHDPVDMIRYRDIQKIGRFKLVKELSTNELFTTFLAVDTYLDRLLILKILNIYASNRENDSGCIEVIKKTAAYGRFNDDSIAIIYDIGRSDGYTYIAREYIESDTLGNWADLELNRGWHESVKIMLCIVEALMYLHKR
ncbi:tetratricopeptide repeat protein, partial [candidate division KSB1 bacterium]|nr:tetratricopeptide repeat protein [candidate division KSB1 bacterium]